LLSVQAPCQRLQVLQNPLLCITTFETNTAKSRYPAMGDWTADLEKKFNIFRETLTLFLKEENAKNLFSLTEEDYVL
jgi:hypothetical protein